MSHSTVRQVKTRKAVKDEPDFSVYVRMFKKLIQEANPARLEQIDGVEELAAGIGVYLNDGIDTTAEGQKTFSLEDRKEVFGQNLVQTFKPRTPLPMTQALINSRLLVPLIVAAMVTTILGLLFEQERENLTWVSSIACWIAFGIIISTSVALDFQLFWTRGRMNHEREVFGVKVIRDRKEQLIKNVDLLVGDILVLTKDVLVAADGVLFDNNDLVIDEQAVTGESKRIKKRLVDDPFCRSGTEVVTGSGRMLVTAVGENSEMGQIMKTVTDSTDYATKFGSELKRFFFLSILPALCLGIVSFIVLLIRWMVQKSGFPLDQINEEGPVQLLIRAIVIMVVELPKGYFLCIFLLLVWLTRKLERDKIYVGNPNAFAEMSSITSICFDKTGTLTENKMRVVQGWFHGTHVQHLPNPEDLNPTILELIVENASVNSEAFLKDQQYGSAEFIGNQTECALLVMTKKFGVDYSEVRARKRPYTIKSYGFNADKKMSSVIVSYGDLLRLYNKGAAEMVLEKCTEYVDQSGTRYPITEVQRSELEKTIDKMAIQGLRTLALTYADLEPIDFSFDENGKPLDESLNGKRGFAEAPDEDLVLLAIVGIKDPIRSGVHRVVNQIRKANITVRMITGDNLGTAKKVARECGILTSAGLAIEGAEFRRRVEEDAEALKKDLPQLRVLARSSPSDKQKLVELLESEGERVAVLGDDINDARAMKEAHVGIAMGRKSTEVVREASDVVILNNNISSILTIYLWSRCFDLSLFGFLKFRLGLSVVVWIVVLVSVCVGGEVVLSIRQLLWANFVTDTLVVLTFAIERPPTVVPTDGSYVGKAPYKTSFVVHIILQSLYQVIVIICTFYSLSSLFERYKFPEKGEFYYDYCQNYEDNHTYKDQPVQDLCPDYLNCPSRDYCKLYDEDELRAQEITDFGFIDHIKDKYDDEHDDIKMRRNSLVFNMFIFLQVFNALNCRKVLNEYNIFEGLFNSPLSCTVRIIAIGLQLLIMLTPVRTLFKVTALNGWEWLYSMGVSIAVLPLSTFIRYMIKAETIEIHSSAMLRRLASETFK